MSNRTRFQPKGESSHARRPVERDYLATMADLVPLDTWREIRRETVEVAKAGDQKARDWLALYLIDQKSMNLLELAADESAELSSVDLIAREARSREQRQALTDAPPFPSLSRSAELLPAYAP